MERLTGRNTETGEAYLFNGIGGVNEAIDKLAAYEDTELEPAEIEKASKVIVSTLNFVANSVPNMLVGRLKEIIRAEGEGRLVVLPCKVGSAVFTINEQYFDCENCKHKEEAHYKAHIDKIACDKEDRHCPLSIQERIVEGFEISKSKNGDLQISDPGQWGYEGLETFYGFDGHYYLTREEAEAALSKGGDE